MSRHGTHIGVEMTAYQGAQGRETLLLCMRLGPLKHQMGRVPNSIIRPDERHGNPMGPEGNVASSSDADPSRE